MSDELPRRFANQVVLVTGGAQGLGEAMASRLAAEGATVCLADTQEELVATTAYGIARRTGATVRSAGVDVTDSGQVRRWVADVVHTLGRVDVLVNNAGVIRDGRAEKLTDDEWDLVLAVSLTGAFYCAREVIPHMQHAGYGRILSFSSMSWRGNFGQANYVAAKAGVVGLARGIAVEQAAHGITSNVIAPGLIDTPMLASMNDRARAKLVQKIPARQVGRPDDIAAGAAFLCSPEAGYITGVVLDIDGGIGIGSSLR